MEPEIDFTNLKKFFNAMEYLREELVHNDKDCPIQRVSIFTIIMLNEGITYLNIAKKAGLHLTTISRNVTELTTFKKKSGDGWISKGCGLVVTEPYEYNRREFSAFLSVKGRKVARRVMKMLA